MVGGMTWLPCTQVHRKKEWMKDMFGEQFAWLWNFLVFHDHGRISDPLCHTYTANNIARVVHIGHIYRYIWPCVEQRTEDGGYWCWLARHDEWDIIHVFFVWFGLVWLDETSYSRNLLWLLVFEKSYGQCKLIEGTVLLLIIALSVLTYIYFLVC